MDTTTSTPPTLIHQHTLPSPSGKTRAWSSRAHPSPRSPLLATASSDKSVQIWDLRDLKLVSNINGGHKRSVRCVGWKDWTGGMTTQQQQPPREKPVTLATGSFDANVGVWVYEPSSLEGQKGQRSDVDELDMTNPPDEAGDEEEEDWHFTTLLTGPDSEIKDLQFSPAHYGANLLATCSRDKSVWVWEEVEDDNEWETIAVLGDHTGDVKCVGWCSGAVVKDGDEEILVGSREILATGSYDDTIRLWRDVEEEGDWMCVAVVLGHKGTVWDVCWEGHVDTRLMVEGVEIREWEPRILSCSDDMTVKVWTRELTESEKEKKTARLRNGVPGERPERLPSSIRSNTAMEKWTEQSTLPEVHVRTVYAIDWSRQTGLVVSCGGDGIIAVYQEVVDDTSPPEDVVMNGTSEHEPDETGRKPTRWTVIAMVEAAHEEYEVNHVCWATRRDKEKRWDGEEVLISTGDDGDVRIWTLPDGVVDEELKTR